MEGLISKIKSSITLSSQAEKHISEISNVRTISKGEVMIKEEVGYRDSEKDWLVDLPKVRKSKEDLITEIN